MSPAKGKPAHDVEPDLQGVRVLIVEDGWQVADALRMSLDKMGMRVVGPTASMEAARDLAAQCNPDLALVDVNLKGELAYPLMDWLHDRGTRIIVMSGYGDLPRSLERFAAILHKPFTATALQTTLWRVMGRDRT